MIMVVPCLVKLFLGFHRIVRLDWPLQGAGQVDVIWWLRPYSQENTVHYICGRLACRSYRKIISVDNKLFSGFHSGFSVSITSIAFSIFGHDRKALGGGGVITRVLLFINKLFPRTKELHAPEAVDGASMSHHRTFSGFELDYLRHMPWEHFINSWSFFPPTPLQLWQSLENI